MPSIALPAGTIDYRAAGPIDADAPPVVFVHGFLVNGELWTGVADALAAQGIRSYAPTLPLGSHTTPMNDGADLTPRGVARIVLDLIEHLELTDVTLVGNDTGGALSQLLLDTDASRIGRIVLTNCDAFDQFPPKPFDLLFRAFRRPALIAAGMRPMRRASVRHSLLGYGPLVARPLDPELTGRWAQPTISDAAIRRDVAAFAKAVDPAELDAASRRLGAFGGPALLVWGAADRFFKVDFARRLAGVFADATLVEIAGGRTFIGLDEPQRVADEIARAFYAGDTTGAALGSSASGIEPTGM